MVSAFKGRAAGAEGGTYVGDTQSGQVVSLAELATHPLAGSGSAAVAQRRRDVASLLCARTTGRGTAGGEVVAHAGRHVGAALGADGRHGVLEGTTGCEMLTVTDSALDRFVLELVFHSGGVDVLGFVLGVLAPVGRQAENDVLAHAGRIHLRALGIFGRQAELGPSLALSDAGVDDLAVCDHADAPGRLDLLAVLVESVGDGGLGAILVLDRLGWRQLGAHGLVEIIVVGPVSTVETCQRLLLLLIGAGGAASICAPDAVTLGAYLLVLDMVAVFTVQSGVLGLVSLR